VKYLIAVFGIFMTIVIIVLLIMLVRSGGGQEANRRAMMTEYTTLQSEVSWTMRGRVVGDDMYNEVRIYVNRNERGIEVTNGYNGRVEKVQTYPNNQEAYTVFMRALNIANFPQEREAPEDDRGYCATGRRYVYELKSGDEQLLRTWGTSCSSDQGSFDGTAKRVRTLFERQITDYKDVVKGYKF
jgi:hypothetical protein